MALQVCSGATLRCNCGTTPSTLIVLPTNRVKTLGQPAANILDHKPVVNVPPFGMCSSLSNPDVAKATTAAGGVLTPQTCVPVTPTPWVPGSQKVKIANTNALHNESKLTCTWAGVIEVVTPGQTKVKIP